MSQKTRILKRLQKGQTLTRMKMITDLGILEGAARICELRGDGWKIRTEMVVVENRYGESTKVARYSLDPAQQC